MASEWNEGSAPCARPTTVSSATPLSVLLLTDADVAWSDCPELLVDVIGDVDECWKLVSQDRAAVVVLAGDFLEDVDAAWISTAAALIGPVVVITDDDGERTRARACGVPHVLPASFLAAPPDLALAILSEHASRARPARDDLEMYMRDSIHEFRTPLTTMIEFAAMLQEGIVGALTDRQEAYVGYVLQAGARQLEQLDDYRDGLRIHLGSLRRRPRRVVVRELIEEATAALRAEPSFSASGDDGTVHVDSVLYASSLARLVDSARKLGTKGAPIRVSARCTGDRFETRVEYDGPPPSDDDQRVVTDGLVERNGSYRSIARVLGMGVALADRFARACGGALELRPRAHGGGALILSLPLRDTTVPT